MIRGIGGGVETDILQHLAWIENIMLNTAYFLHTVYLPFQYIGYVYFRLCLLIC